jgi:hypothetical protein
MLDNSAGQLVRNGCRRQSVMLGVISLDAIVEPAKQYRVVRVYLCTGLQAKQSWDLGRYLDTSL